MTMIKFPCPHCKKTLSVKEHLAGKKAACPACKQALVIPMPRAKPEDVEALAAAALADKPAEAEAAPKDLGTIDFNCPQCDEPIKVSVEFEGKQTPCPECRRIIKVPMRVKRDPTDWRKLDTRLPSAARRDTEPAPEGAWGTVTSGGAVSRQALLEADAIPGARERLTLAQKIKRGALVSAGVLVVGLVVWGGMYLWVQGKERRALNQALAALKAGTVKSPESAAEIHRAAGEYYLAAGKAEEALSQFQSSRSQLAGNGTSSSERDCVLLDLALAQIDLGGDEQEVLETTRIKWDDVPKELRQTLQNVRSPEARLNGLRNLSRKLLAKGQGAKAVLLAAQLSEGDEAAEALARVGLELLRAKQTPQAEQIADQALLAMPPARPNVDMNRPRPFVPSLIALCLALDKRDKAAALVPEPRGDMELQPVARIGYAEGWARKGEWDRARKLATAPGLAMDRFQALARLVAVAVDKDQAETARQDLDACLNLLDTELREKPPSAWQLLRLVQLGLAAGQAERIKGLVGKIPNAHLRGRAQLEVVRARLAAMQAPVEESLAQEVSKDTPAHALALESLARHNARFGDGSAMQKAIGTWEPEPLRAFGSIGVALGMRDSAR